MMYEEASKAKQMDKKRTCMRERGTIDAHRASSWCLTLKLLPPTLFRDPPSLSLVLFYSFVFNAAVSVD